jgi:diguanylate cyclase (GGDEF)-like protein
MTLKMSHLAHHDALTDLPNRLLLNDRLARAIEVGRRHRRPVAVLFLDLDRFKNINDLLGHDVGDDVLRSVAERLTGRLRSSDTISRQGGDEFVIVLSDIDRPSNVIVTAKKILDAVAKPHRIRRHELRLTASIGISVYPNDGYDARGLLKDAEIAMYQAKTRGGNRYEFFQPEMNVRAVERQSLVHGLLRALDRDEFVLHYQPKIDLSTGAIIGAEALVRWRHPQLGVLRPPRFVPVAEDSGLIVPLGRWVLRRACRQARAWQDAGLRPTTVAVNVSAVELRHPGFLDGVRKTLEQTRLEPRCLELEVTETVFMSNTHSTLSVLQDLKALGLQLALDDFGTGYSSLSHLNEFPIDTLKVDESFVRDITRGDQDSPVVRAVISMGKSLNQRVIAEGVETVEQLGFLQKQGCSAGQGYYFSRPLPARQYARLLTPAGSESTH